MTFNLCQATVLSRKRADCPLQVGEELLTQVEEFSSDGKMEQEIVGTWGGIYSSVVWSIVVRKELRQSPELSIY